MFKNVRRVFILSFIMVFVMLMLVITVLAAPINLSGSVDTTDESVASFCGADYQKIIPFTVSTTGTYLFSNLPPFTISSGDFFYVQVNTISTPDTSTSILGANNSGVNMTGTLTAGTNYYMHIGGCNTVTTYPVNYTFTLDICSSCNPSSSPDTDPQPAFTDGRINNYDVAAPVAVYPHEVNGEIGLIIYAADGTLLLVVSPEQIAVAPENPASNILIVEGNNVALYRTPEGKWQINAPQYNGKTYVLIFPELSSSGGYESHEE